jgi:hypothetical protein
MRVHENRPEKEDSHRGTDTGADGHQSASHRMRFNQERRHGGKRRPEDLRVE